MAAHPEPTLDEHLWTIAAARLAAAGRRRRAGAAEPRLRRLPAPARRRHRRLGRRLAGHDRPRQPRGAVARARAARARRRARAGSSSRRGCRSTRATSPARVARPGRAADGAARGRRARARARGRLAPGRDRRASRSSSRATRCRSTRRRRAGRGGARAALPRPRRGARSASSRPPTGCAARSAATRSPTSSRGTSSTRTSATSAAASAPSRRASWRRTCAARRTSSRSTRSSAAPGGVGARRDRGLPAGRHPPGLHRRLLRVRRRRDPGRGCPICTCTRSRRSRSGRARRRSACRSSDYLARLRDARPRLAAGHGGRDPRRRGARGHLPRQGHDRAVARGARGRAPRRPALERDDHVRARRAAASTGRATCCGRASSSERTGGFTEFVPLPFVHMEAPMWLQGRARRGPTFGESLLVHAVARLALHPAITNIQASWVKLGPEGVAGRAARRRRTTSAAR